MSPSQNSGWGTGRYHRIYINAVVVASDMICNIRFAVSREDKLERKETRMMEKIVLVVLCMLLSGVWADVPGMLKPEETDLYGIADPTQRLAAIRAKWPNAGDVVSQWKMPEYEERFSEIDRLQDWCNEDKPSK